MKHALIVAALLIFGVSSPIYAATLATAPSCSTIKVVSVSKGTSLPCLSGLGSTTFEAIRGPVLVNVWGSWCEPCKEEIPRLVDIARLKKIAIVGIDVEERNIAAGRNFVASHKMSWPQLYDVKAVTRGIFGMGVPVTWFIDARGKVTYRQIGLFQSDAQIKELVLKYLGVTL